MDRPPWNHLATPAPNGTENNAAENTGLASSVLQFSTMPKAMEQGSPPSDSIGTS